MLAEWFIVAKLKACVQTLFSVLITSFEFWFLYKQEMTIVAAYEYGALFKLSYEQMHSYQVL